MTSEGADRGTEGLLLVRFRRAGWNVNFILRRHHVAFMIDPPTRPFFGMAALKGTPPCIDWKDRTIIRHADGHWGYL